MKPFLSVIIPCYNSEAFLHRCVDSLCPQLTADCELILVDDGSTDATLAICTEYRRENVRVIHIENRGNAGARQAGIDIAEGEYIWLVDSDDYVEPNAIAVIRQALEEKPDLLCFGHDVSQNDKTEPASMRYPTGSYQGEAMREIRRGAVLRCFGETCYFWNQIYRAALVRQVPMLDRKVYGPVDAVFNLRFYPHMESLRVIDSVLYHYIRRPGSVSYYAQRHAEHMLNCFCAVREDYMKQGIYGQYWDVLAFCVMNFGFLAGCNKMRSALAMEYALCDNLETAHENVREILASPLFKELLAEAKKLEVPPKFRLCYDVMEQENADALYKLIRAF